MKPFVCDLPAYRVIFGPGSLDRLPDEVARIGGTRAVIISMPAETHFAEEASRRLGARSAGVYSGVTAQHVPIEMLREAKAHTASVGADCYVVIGGGSTVGVGKGLALETGLPIVAVPTTYAGSEMTPIYGLTEGGVKKTGRDRKVMPKSVIYDVNLTLTLPPRIAGPSGMNAMAHCVEALYADDGNPIVSLLAEEGIRALGRSLPVIMKSPTDVDARSDAQYGAWLGGTVLGAVNMSIHHKLCHTLGGSFTLPHAETHTIVLPHATAYNRDAAPEAMRRIAAALGAQDAADGIYDLIERIGAPRALKDIGMPPEGLDRVADLALQARYPNPRPLEHGAIRALLQRAYDGSRP